MVKDSMDLLEILRKRGVNGDVDFLREALRVLMDAIMDAEVSSVPTPSIGGLRWVRGKGLAGSGTPVTPPQMRAHRAH